MIEAENCINEPTQINIQEKSWKKFKIISDGYEYFILSTIPYIVVMQALLSHFSVMILAITILIGIGISIELIFYYIINTIIVETQSYHVKLIPLSKHFIKSMTRFQRLQKHIKFLLQVLEKVCGLMVFLCKNACKKWYCSMLQLLVFGNNIFKRAQMTNYNAAL